MKTGLIIGIVIIAVLVVGGFFLMSGNKQTTGINTNNELITNQETNTQTTTQEKLTTHNIEISNFAFSPKEIKIKKGDTIIWTNKDSAKHTITSDSGNELDSDLLADGESYSHTFTETGAFDYHCTPHPYMKAKVVVE